MYKIESDTTILSNFKSNLMRCFNLNELQAEKVIIEIEKVKESIIERYETCYCDLEINCSMNDIIDDKYDFELKDSSTILIW